MFHPFLVEQPGHPVHSISFGDGTAVQHHPLIVLHYLAVFQSHFPVAHERLEAVYHARIDVDGVFEPESPGVHQRSYGDVECPVRFLGNLFCQRKHMREVFVQHGVLVVVDTGNDGVRIVGGEGVVHLHQGLLDVVLQVVGMLVGDFVHRAEHHPFVGAKRRLFLQDDYRSDYQ